MEHQYTDNDGRVAISSVTGLCSFIIRVTRTMGVGLKSGSRTNVCIFVKGVGSINVHRTHWRAKPSQVPRRQRFKFGEGKLSLSCEGREVEKLLMARMLMCASRLFPLLHCKICRPGISGTYFQIRNYTKSGKRKSKSDGIDNEEDKVCEKELALKKALDQVASFFGKESTMWLRRCTSPRCVPVISSGSFALDAALGIGGFPKGRIVEIYGPEASGKTTLALHVIAEAQKDGGYCVFVDAEHALDPALAEAIGVNTENLMLSQPDSGEQALSLVDTLIQSGSVDVVVVDSVAALVPKTELDGEIGDAHIAVQARLISQALRKLIHSLSLSRTVLIFTNQVRSKLNTCGRYGGPTEVSSGGNALKFYASVRLNIKRIGLITKGEEIIGSEVLVKVVKNKLAPPFKTAQFELEFGKGINRGSEILELGCKHKLITKSGLYYTIYDQSFHGKDSVMRYLEHADVQGELLMKLREKLLHSGVVEREEKEDDLSPDSLEDELAPLVIEA